MILELKKFHVTSLSKKCYKISWDFSLRKLVLKKKYKKHKIRTLTHCLYLLSHYLHSCKEFIDKEKRIKSEFILRSMNSLNFLLQYPHNFTSSHLWDWIFPFHTIFLVCAVAIVCERRCWVAVERRANQIWNQCKLASSISHFFSHIPQTPRQTFKLCNFPSSGVFPLVFAMKWKKFIQQLQICFR